MHRSWESYYRMALARVRRGETDADATKRAAKFADAAVREQRRREQDEDMPRDLLVLVERAFSDVTTKLTRADLRTAILASVERDVERLIDEAHSRCRIDRCDGREDLFELGIPF